MLTRALNVGLRLATLIGRFVLFFALAKYLPTANFAEFGLIVAFVNFGVLFVGAEFYQFTVRELISVSREERGRMVAHQACAALILYLALIPGYIGLASYGFVVSEYMLLVLMILIFEHIAQELYRILVVLDHQVYASVQLFLRSALWGWGVSIAIVVFDYRPQLEEVLYLWAAFSLASVFYGAAGLKGDLKVVFPFRIDRAWITKGVRVAGLFFFSALALRALTTMDKFLVAYLSDENTTAAYVFFFGIAMVLVNVLDPAVFAFSYPKLIAHWRKETFEEFKKEYWRMARHTIILIFFAGLGLYVSTPYVLRILDNQVYSVNVIFLPILLLMAGLQGVSLVPHYGLYAMGKDRALIASHYGGFFVFVISVATLSYIDEALAVPIALCLAFMSMLFVKGMLFTTYFKLATAP